MMESGDFDPSIKRDVRWNESYKIGLHVPISIHRVGMFYFNLGDLNQDGGERRANHDEDGVRPGVHPTWVPREFVASHIQGGFAELGIKEFALSVERVKLLHLFD